MAGIIAGQQQNGGINGTSGLTPDPNNVNLQSQQGQNSPDDIFGGFDNEDDKNLSDLLSGFGTETETEFEVGDDWLTPPKGEDDDGEGDDSSQGEDGKELMQELEAMMKQISIDDASLPENFDWNDRGKVKGLLNHTAQKAAVSALAMLTKPMKKYVESIAAELRSEMSKTVKKGGIQGKIQDAFEPFKTQLSGEKNKPKLAYAIQTFKQALNVQKDPRKAALATQRMLKQLGINVQLSARQGNTGTGESFASQRFEGSAALDDLFGNMK